MTDDINPDQIKADIEQKRRERGFPPPTPGNPFREQQQQAKPKPKRKAKPKDADNGE